VSVVKVDIRHTWYGCETGCCGHSIEVDGEGRSGYLFFFEHPDKDVTPEAFAHELVRQAHKDAPGGWFARMVNEAGGYELGEVEVTDVERCDW
jgi:hypothetical protein